MLRELAECVLVLLLNSHLIDYFSPRTAPDRRRALRVESLPRDRFGSVLQTNRPLRSITDDIARRPIDTPHQRVRLATRFLGLDAQLPSGFLSRYAKIDPLDRRHGARPYEVTVEIEATSRLRLGVPESRQVRRSWLDDFLAASQDAVDIRAFLAAINWPTVAAVLRCLTPDDRSEARAAEGNRPGRDQRPVLDDADDVRPQDG